VSIGVRACRPHHGDQIDAILDQADQALFEAKRLGRNRVVLWDAPITSPSA
ncbi:MAG: diguanylate cyclase, partial [Spirochaetaceae bacterium]